MINIRLAEQRDLGNLVALHYSSGVLGLLRKLTPSQLSSFYYAPLLATRREKCFIAENSENGQIVGFIAASRSGILPLASSPLTRSKMGFRITTQLFSSPDLILRLINYIAANRFLSNYQKTQACFEIDLILVDRSVQSSGIGTILMDFFLQSVDRGARIVVQTQNIEALKFYSKFGFNVIWKKSLLGIGLWVCERNL